AQQIKPPDALPDNAPRIAVCPVPMHWMRRWKRGYNQSFLIAEALARQTGYPLVELLRRTRRTPPQTAVTHSMRRANVRGSFAIRPVDAAGWTIWLVDDVKTTGATARACATLLRQAGAEHVNLAVVAVAGENPDPPLE
ncbi:MAG: ComF family protein, partial [Phycisphaeraceae bacterium]|nr:ComF family protein [Phycisphaeraceae bacterium]